MPFGIPVGETFLQVITSIRRIANRQRIDPGMRLTVHTEDLETIIVTQHCNDALQGRDDLIEETLEARVEPRAGEDTRRSGGERSSGCRVENVKGMWRECRRVGCEKNERNLLSRQQVVVMLPGKWHGGGLAAGYKAENGKKARGRENEIELKEEKGDPL